MSQAEIENELRKHGSGFMGGKQRIMALYQTQTDRNLRAKALAKEYGVGGHSHDFLDGSRGFVNHDWKGLEFDHYPDHQKITLKWTQVEQYIDLMIQSDRYLTDKKKEHYTPPSPVNAKTDADLTHAKNLIRDFCLEEYDSEPDFSDLSKIDIAYTNATDEEIPIQVSVDLVGYRVERYEVKRGKHTAVKGKGQKRFIRFRTLGTGYGEDEIKAVLEGKAKHQPYQKKPSKEQPFQLLVDIQGKMVSGKSVGYKKWATKFNLKEMSKTLLFLQEQKISSADELRERAAAATERYHAMGDSIKAAEARLTEIAVLKTHIINYAKTRDVYAAYRKAGYSKAFLEAHREEIALHKAAKAAFDEAGLQKLPRVKELDAEFSELLTKKKAAYPDYRKARNEMQELVRAQKNVERFFAEEKTVQENEQAR